MKFRSLLVGLAVFSLLAPQALASTAPVNEGGLLNAAVTDAVATYISGAKGVVKGVAIWSASAGRFWDPVLEGGGGGTASLAPWTPDNGSLTTAAPTGTSSLSAAFSGSGTTVYVKNLGTAAVHVRPVLTTGTALVTDERLQPGMCGPFARGTADRLALITDSGTGSVEITTGTGNPGFGLCTDMSAASATNPTASTAGGFSGYTYEVAASDNHQVIKNGAGTWYGFDAWSKHSAALYQRFYDAGTGFNGCNSATNLMWEGEIPANATPANGAGLVRPFGDIGRKFTSGLAVCTTGAFGNTDTTNATASVASVNVGFK